MSNPINLSLPKSVELKPRIVVIGVGGAGGNAVNNMIASGLDGVEFVVANTDAQALSLSRADRRIQMGGDITEGLGAGMRPEIGEESAEDSMAEILEQLDGAHMLFIAAGMGGGTGTGAAPVIARAARERGILTVAIVTKPFQFEGSNRMRLAEDGVSRLQPMVDTLITIPNQNLFRIATESTTMTDAFGLADEVVGSALDPDLEGIVRVSVVATGVDAIDGEIEDDRGNYPRYNAPVSTYEDDEVEAEEEPVAAFTPPPAPVRPTYSPSVASSAPAYAQHIQQPATAPQAPVQAPAPTPAPVAQAPAPAPAPIPEPVPAAAQQSVFRNTFGLWGRKKEQARQATPRQQQPASQPRPTGDLFGANVDDELEIPSFLRRQNK